MANCNTEMITRIAIHLALYKGLVCNMNLKNHASQMSLMELKGDSNLIGHG